MSVTSFVIQLFETSALDDSHANHVDSIFMTLAHKLKASKPMMTASPSGPGGMPSPSIVLQRRDSQSMDSQSAEESQSCYC